LPLHVVRSVAEAAAVLDGSQGPVVAVPVYNSPLDVQACMGALLTHTAASVPILVIDDASPDTTSVDSVRALGPSAAHRVVLLEHSANSGFVGSCNDAFAAAGRHDVVLVNSDVVVGPEWLHRMSEAARSSNTVATVSALTNHGSILSVPNRNHPGPLPAGLSVDDAARRVASAAARTRPVLPTGVGHCLYVTRTALDVVGGFDPVFAPGYGEEVDFCLRAAEHGLLNVLADDVFVYHKGGSSFGASPEKLRLQADHEAIVNRRHPRYESYRLPFETSTRSAFAFALARARRSLAGITVAVDGFSLGPEMMGTQRFVVETACALAACEGIDRVDLFTPLEVPDYVRRAVAGRPRLRVRPHAPFELAPERYDVAIRPYQVDHPVQLQWMRQMADAVVVTQLDLIAYHNPGYFGSDDTLRAYREITAATFDIVDGVAFISEHSRAEAVREGLLGRRHHSAVTHCGIDHRSDSEQPVQPEAAPHLRPGFVLVLGAAYLHKHRMHAVETWRLLREQGFAGQLALVGPTPASGSSVEHEHRWLEQHPALAADVIALPSVSEAEKAWLLRNAALVAYPTLSEGFGMVPFEAALAGTPVLTTRQGALHEVLPADLHTLDSMVPADAVALAQRLLTDADFRQRQVALLARAAAGFTWADSAASLVGLMRRSLDEPGGRVALQLPAPPAARRSRAVLVDRLVSGWARLPRVVRAMVGDGTRRQAAVRRVANWARRRLS
jgi:GT2 family glycosyltransferase